MAHQENDSQSRISLETVSAGELAAKDLVGRFTSRVEENKIESVVGKVWRDGKPVPEDILKGLDSRENVNRD